MKKLPSFDEFSLNEQLISLKREIESQELNEGIIYSLVKKLKDFFDFVVMNKHDIADAFQNSVDLIYALLKKDKAKGLLALANLYQNLENLKAGYDDIKQQRAEEAEALLFNSLDQEDQEEVAKLADIDAKKVKKYRKFSNNYYA